MNKAVGKTKKHHKPEPKQKNFKFYLHKYVRLTADTPLPEIAFVVTFILARWWLNSDFSYPKELIVPISLFAVLAVVIYYVYRLILGKGLASHSASLLFIYGLYGYIFVHDSKIGGLFLKLLPGKWSTEFTQSIFLGLIMFALAGLIGWSLNKLNAKNETFRGLQPYKVILFMVVFTFSIQIVRFANRYVQISPAIKYQYQSPLIAEKNTPTASKPDIYYIVFDRYNNQEQLKKNFNFDNSELMSFLNDNGFVTRDGAYSNYPFTMSSVSSTMAMNYLDEFKDKFNQKDQWQSDYPYRSIFNDPPIAQILKQNGYQYNHLSSWWDFSRIGNKLADTEPTKSFKLTLAGKSLYLSDLQRDIIHKSIFSPWFKKGVQAGDFKLAKYELDRHPRENFEVQMNELKDIAARSDKSKPTYTFAHILAPHPPYVFLQDGSWPAYDGEANDNGADETIKYTNELTYVNSRMQDLVKTIRTHSPNAVIMIQADEGPYPKQFRGDITASHYYDPEKLPLDKMQQKFGILASYYLPGVEKDKVREINSSVNAFRVILNNYLGYSLPLLPDCNYSMGNKFNVYDYHLVTKTLTGKDAPTGCAQ